MGRQPQHHPDWVYYHPDPSFSSRNNGHYTDSQSPYVPRRTYVYCKMLMWIILKLAGFALTVARKITAAVHANMASHWHVSFVSAMATKQNFVMSPWKGGKEGSSPPTSNNLHLDNNIKLSSNFPGTQHVQLCVSKLRDAVFCNKIFQNMACRKPL